MKFLRYKSLFSITLDESLILLFILKCKTMFLVSVLNTASGNLSCHLQWHGSSENLTLTEFGFPRDSLLSSISWNMKSLAIDVVPFAHCLGVVGEVLLLLQRHSFFWLKTVVVLVNLISASCSSGVSLTFFLWSYSSLSLGVDRSTICYCCRNWWFQQPNLNPKLTGQYQDRNPYHFSYHYYCRMLLTYTVL